MYRITKSFPLTILSLAIVGIIAIQSFDLFGNKKNEDSITAIFPVANDETGCAHDHLLEKELENNPALQAKLNASEVQYQNFINNPIESFADYTLPVVFHIVHDEGSENIDDAQVAQAVEWLNEAYANTGYYDQDTGVNTEIEFCLAKTGPDGNPHPGITRTQNAALTELNMETEDLDLKTLIQWDPTQYINIYVVRSVGGTGINTQVTGYAYLPAFHGTAKDGIVVEAMFAGSDEMMTSILAHHMGHYLGLYHTYEGGCTNDNCQVDGDRVCDTPPDWTVAQPPCDVTVNSCYTDVNPSDPNNPFTEDQNDMRENYMDWSPTECYSAFTQGQADRMSFFINGDRSSLLNSTVCTNACDDPILDVSFTPGNDTIISVNSQIAFVATATNATTFEWFVDGVSSGTGATFVNNFTPVGTYNITLTASNGDPDCDISVSAIFNAVDCYGSAHVNDGTGVDVAMCGGTGNPCKTIQYAMDNIACSGDTIYIHSGTYSLAGGVDATIPIAEIPEDYSFTFFGVEDNGPVLIDGGNMRRGFKYIYSDSGNPQCAEVNVGNGIDVTHQFKFENLTIQNCKITAVACDDGIFRGNGAGMYIVGNDGSDITLTVDNCKFFNNIAEDLSNLNNNGRSNAGGAIYFNGRVDDAFSAGTGGRAFISNSEFSSNRAEQFDNGGQGGAIFIANSDTTNISSSYFCNNTVFSGNADGGDFADNRNAGGAICLVDNFSPVLPQTDHNYIINECVFLGNSALTTNGASLPDQSKGGGVYIGNLSNSTITSSTANLFIGNSNFFNNTIETGQQDFFNANGATINISNIGNNTFSSDDYMFTLGNDTTICNIDSITIGLTETLPNAFYFWSSGQNTPTITVSDTGVYILTVTLGACSVMDTMEISEIICGEVCGNGIDDDGNGLIDCYDPACCANGMCNDQYYNACPDDCTFNVTDNTFDAEVKWQSAQNLSTFSTAITGDIDADGIPEILVHQGGVTGSDKFSIIGGQSGQQEVVLTISQNSVTPAIPAIADIDGDGSAEIFIYGEANSTIHRFEHDGSLTATAQIVNASTFVKAINVADFDEDGQDEIYFSNVILDANTLATKVVLPTTVAATNVGVAADILPDTACPGCDGLELVVGNTVYSINLATGVSTPVETFPSSFTGIASLGDIDNDGDVDAVVSNFNNANPGGTTPYIFAWDLQTDALIAQYSPADNASVNTLADIDGDGLLEVVFKTSTELVALENDLTVKWSIPISNPGLNMNASVAFDFDGDGDYEIVDQDALQIRVIDGTNGNVLFSDMIGSIPGFQNPIVADVDADGLTEIVIVGATSTISLTNNMGRIITYESDSYPWQTTRQVWNQFNWFHVNVQDDLELPMIQQQHHLIPALNNFRVQHGEQIGSDATITLVESQCRLEFIDLTVEVCNTGTNHLSNTTPIAFYTENPTTGNASLLDTEFLGSILPADSCTTLMLTIPSQYVDPIFIVVNDDGSVNAPFNLATDFPSTNIGECDYTNNMTSFFIDPEPYELDLGPDLFVCDNAAVVLDATSNFVSYEWQDGSTEQTFTAEDGGEYYVIVVDSCGGIQGDTIQITVDPNTVNETTPELAVICPTENVTFTVNGDFDTFQWRPTVDDDDFLNCDTCQVVIAEAVTEATQYIVTASNSVTGCYSVDTVQIQLTSLETSGDIQACAGDAVIIHGESVTAPGVYTDTFTSVDGCDSTSMITFTNYPSVNLSFTTVPTCPQGSTGTATVLVDGGVATNYVWSTGDTGTPTITNLPVGNYTVIVTDANLCETVGSVDITDQSNLNIQTQFMPPTCVGDSDGSLTILNGQATWTYSIDGTNFQASPIFDGIAAATYTINIQDTDGCLYTGTGVVEDPPGIFVAFDPNPIELEFPATATVNTQIGSENPIVSYSWSPSTDLSCDDCPNPEVSGSQGGSYVLTVTDEIGCTGQGTLIVNVNIDCDPERAMLPNVFTPDNDDLNDDFGIVLENEGFERVNNMRIFNRWGQVVYQSDGETDPRWDGTHNDKPAPSDVYVYFVRIGCEIDPNLPEVVKTGEITLIR